MGEKKEKKNASCFCIQTLLFEEWPHPTAHEKQWLKRNKTGNEAGHPELKGYPQHGSSFFSSFCANIVRKQNQQSLSTRSIAPCRTGRTWDDHSHRHRPHNREMGKSMLDCRQEATFPITQRTRLRSFSSRRGNRRTPMGHVIVESSTRGRRM